MSELTVRVFEGSDYEDICDWWKEHKWSPVPIDHLPRLGFVVEGMGKKFCAVFLYFTDGGFGWLEWLVSNPKAPLKKRKAALELVVSHALQIAKSAGVKSVFTSLKNKNLERLYQEKGFQVTDREVTHLIARLN